MTSGTNQSTPIVVDGVIYIESAFGDVVAVDGRTGVTRWKYTQTRGNLTRRGVAVGQGLVYPLSGDNFVVALNSRTPGKSCESVSTRDSAMSADEQQPETARRRACGWTLVDVYGRPGMAPGPDAKSVANC